MTKDGVHSIGHQPGGFTAVEVLIVIAILMALVAVAIPNLSGWATKQRLKSAARDLFTHFQYARLEAVKRNSNISFTFNTGENAGPDGYRVFVDDGNRVQESGKNEITLIDVQMPNDVILESTTFSDNAWGMNAFSYNARGFPVEESFPGTVTEAKVTVETVPIFVYSRRVIYYYEVTLQKFSGGLKLKELKEEPT